MQPFIQVLLLLSLLIFVAKIAGHLSACFGQPTVFGKILAGVILGPTILNIQSWQIFSFGIQPNENFVFIFSDWIGKLGVVLLMFIAGLETDIEAMKEMGKNSFWSALGGVILPFCGGFLFTRYFLNASIQSSLFVGSILTATSISITAQTLMELKVLRSKEAVTILGAAVIDDILGIIILSLVVAFATKSNAGVSTKHWEQLLGIAVFIIFSIIAIKWGNFLFEWFMQVMVRLAASEMLLSTSLIICFFLAWASEKLGLADITGSYLAGFLLAQTTQRDRILGQIRYLVFPLFVPIFFLTLGLNVNARALSGGIVNCGLLIMLAIITKVIGCWVGAYLSGMPMVSAIRVGIGMISRGEVGLIIASLGLAQKIIGENMFSQVVLIILVSTMVTPPLLRLIFPRTSRMPKGVT